MNSVMKTARPRRGLRRMWRFGLLASSVGSFVIAVISILVGIWTPEFVYNTTDFSEPVWVYGQEQRWEGTGIVFIVISIVTGVMFCLTREFD